MRVGGHTPGSQMVVADTAAGKAILTGDAIPTNRNFVEDIHVDGGPASEQGVLG